ncbi:MAG TPA: hypothetical protein VM123_12360 [archaeon]|nr:hypothetical protein [archaeon]
MDCREFEKLIQDYVEGLCNKKLRRAMDKRRSECSHCNSLAKLHEGILAALETTEPVKAPESLSAKILTAVEAEEAKMAILEERILAVLESTEPVKAPAGLSERILAVVEAEEAEMAAELSYTRRVVVRAFAWTASVGAAFFSLWKYYAADPLVQASAYRGLASVYRGMASFLSASGELLTASETQGQAGTGWFLTLANKWFVIMQDWFARIEMPEGWMKGIKASPGFFSQTVPLPFVSYQLPVYFLAGAVILGLSLWYYTKLPLTGAVQPVRR